MTSSPQQDPLVALWQTAPGSDTRHLLNDLQRLNRLHRRLNRSVSAIMCGIAILLIFEEATGRTGSHGILSAVWILGIAIGVIWHKRARCSQADALTLDTISLLKSMIARAKRDLHVARCLYAGVPCGAAVGFVAAKVMGLGGPRSAKIIHPHLHMMQTGADIAALVIMVVAGTLLARSRHIQVQELSEKLKLMEADL